MCLQEKFWKGGVRGVSRPPAVRHAHARCLSTFERGPACDSAILVGKTAGTMCVSTPLFADVPHTTAGHMLGGTALCLGCTSSRRLAVRYCALGGCTTQDSRVVSSSMLGSRRLVALWHGTSLDFPERDRKRSSIANPLLGRLGICPAHSIARH